MTPSEIRTRQDAIAKDMDARESVDGQSDIQRQEEMMLGVCFWLAEIAGQLAEDLEHMKKITYPINAESPWVWLTFDRKPFVVDRNEVTGVAPLYTGTEDMPAVSIGMKGELWSKSADGTMAEVCAKLGIPVEES
jgi:hypothetical protein